MNFNQTPYFDDFDEQKKFYKVLFRPGVAVQTREVNQLQGILQNQITKLGDHIFREGSMVIPGQVNYNDKLKYLKISGTSLGTESLSYLQDKTISQFSDGTGITALIVNAIAATTTDPITLVLLYTAGNEDGTNTGSTFAASSTLYVVEDNTKTLTVAAGSDISGRSVAAGIQNGVYYLADHFVSVSSQVISVKKYADTLTDINVRVGIKYTESVVTSDEDSSLLDNAAGSPNYAAPGAHRFKIDVVFFQCGLDEDPEQFFELLRVEEGVLQSIINASQYNILEETLARRTFDESGNYVVDNFIFDIRENRTNNRGNWSQGAFKVGDYVKSTGGKYFTCIQSGSSASTEPSNFDVSTSDESVVITDGSTKWRYIGNPRNNGGYILNGSSSNLTATFGLGKAYVGGYEIQKSINSNVTISKARDIRSQNNANIQTPQGNYIYVDKRYSWGTPNLSQGSKVLLFDRTVGYRTAETQKFGHGQQVGVARINWAEPDARGSIRLGLSDIVMEPNRSFDQDANCVLVADSTTSTATTSYSLSGLVRYAGNSTSAFLTLSGTIGTSSQGSTYMGVTGTLTAFTNEFRVGDTITLGVAGHSATSSWTVVGISSNTVMYLSGKPLAGAASTAVLVRVPAQTVIGLGTGNTTLFTSELRIGDRLYLGNATIGATGTVLGFNGDRRVLVSSALSTITASTAIGIYYTGPVASFVGDVFDSYQYGINARKLTGSFSAQFAIGAGVHRGLIIQGTNDARMLTELRTNDLINLNNNRIFITKVSSNSVAYGVCLDVDVTNTGLGGSTIYPGFRLNNNLVDTKSSQLIYPVKNATQNIVDNVYTIYKTQSVSGVSGSSSISVNLAAANPSLNAAVESLATTDVNAFYVAQDTAASLSPPITVNNVTLSGTTVILSINSTFSSNSARVNFPVQRSADSANSLGHVRSKTLTFSASDEYLSSSAAIKATLNFTRSDVYRIVKIYMASSFVASWSAATQANATDVSARYYLDNGQRDIYYDVGRAILQPGFPTPTGSIKVFYDYFDHGSGDFFARSSYDELVVPYETIPVYNNYNLGDVLDFRSKINVASGNLDSLAPPRFGTNYTADISFYLGRKEKIYLDRNSEFYNVSGVSEEAPEFPKVAQNNNSINLYDIELKPYTKTSEYPDVLIKNYDNKRYTMRDIGRINRRVQQLEEVSALNLLETATKSLQIRDNLDSTLERYKTGFFVDNFADANNGENGGDARYSIDFQNQTMNPNVDYYSFPLVEKLNYTVANTTATELDPVRLGRFTDNYKISGDLLTVYYTTSNVLKQVLATTSIAVAPFLTATFLGKLRVIPDQDIYQNVIENKIVTQTVGTSAEQAVAAYRATRDWRPYQLDVSETVTLQSQNSTTELIPFCRAQSILLIAEGMKPRGKFFTFFDDTPIDNYITGAVKFTFDSLPVLEFTQNRVNGTLKDELPRYRSSYETVDVRGTVRVNVGNQWVDENGWIRRSLNPRDNDLNIPSAANRDAFRTALSSGSSVWYYERTGGVNRIVGTGVAVYQDGNTLYIVNGRGKLSDKFLRSVTNYDYSAGTFYLSVDQKEPKFVRAVYTAAQVCTSDANGNLYSDAKGVVVGLLDLPDTDTLKFITGKKPVVMTDDPENHPDNWTSKADALYTVEGFTVTVTTNYLSTKTFTARPYDPVAQSFKLPSQFENGAFITDVDVFFAQKPVFEQAPVQLEIRTCDSTGRPSGTEIVPGSDVLKYPEQVNVDATRAQTPTKFTFKTPVYLMPEKNYAVVLKTDSKNYKIWIATLGQNDVNTPTSSYTTQATLGSFFKSQDGTLWTEDQFSDMKFNINRAVFSTNPAQVHVVNKDIDTEQLPINPLTFIHGSNKVRVTQPNHGFSSGDTTKLFSKYWAGQYALNNDARIANIPVGELFGKYISSTLTEFQSLDIDLKLTASRVTMDTFEVTVSSVANLGATAVTGVTALISGGEDVIGHANVLYHIVKPSARIMSFQPTNMGITGKILRSFTYDGADPITPYTHLTKSLEFNTNNILDTSCVILTATNEYDRVNPLSITSGGVNNNWSDSFIGVINLSTTTDHVSPVIDLSTLYLDLMTHRIDNPAVTRRLPVPLPAIGSTSNIILMTTVANSSTTIAFDGNQQAITTTDIRGFEAVVPGRYLNIRGSTESTNTFTSSPVLVTRVSEDAQTVYVSAVLTSAVSGPGITIYQYDDYTEETTTINASGESKYIIRKINLENPATALRIIAESCIPSAADFDVYYKTGSVSTDFNKLVWEKFVAPRQTTIGATSSYVSIVKSDVRGRYTDIEFNISDLDSTENPVDLTPFTAFQIKIVMRSSNGARIPQFKTLRVVAHA